MHSRWSDKDAARCANDAELRVYTSRLLGSEPSLVLHGGGNTSVKLTAKNVLGEGEEILLVKGSGWDLATIELAGFSPVRLEHLRRVASCDVCVTPSRWEGLGLPLYEATAFGMPIVVNDNPPMNEVVTDGENGLLVRGIQDGTAKSGIPAHSPDVADLAGAFERLADPGLRARLAEGSRRRREELAWSRTVEGFGDLLERLTLPTHA